MIETGGQLELAQIEAIRVSHLMFADDVLLFGEATTTQMKCITRILNKFCSMSGQQASHEKNIVYFSKNVKRSKHVELVNMSGFIETTNLGKYIGVPLTIKAPKR